MFVLLVGVIGVITAALVVAVEGVSAFAIWNLIPVVLAVLGMATATRPPRARSVRVAAVAFGLGCLLCVALLHLAWQFDWRGTSSGSSTAGLLFVVAPVLAVVVGLVTAGVAAVGARMLATSNPEA